MCTKRSLLMVIVAAGILLAGSGYTKEKDIASPSKYPAEWGVSFGQRPPLEVGVGYCEPPHLGANACFGKYLGFNPGTTTFTKGTNVYPHTFALPCDIVMDRDVAITLRDGVKIYVDVLRPAGGSNLPAIISWSPYTKSVPQDPVWVYSKGQVPPNWVSGLGVFEGPDPGFWCCNGYAVITVDPRGIDMSEGDMHCWGMVDAADGHEVIEWAARQPWSNGKVGMHGTSWLAMLQWWIGATQPPHLAALAPWGAHIHDLYRNRLKKGGIPNTKLNKMLLESMRGTNRFEQPYSMVAKYPLMAPYWEDKAAKLENIKIPLYLVGSYGLEGAAAELDGFFGVASKDKWLRITNEGLWTDQYDPKNQEDLLRFFDRYLKGIKNSWEETPRVRVAVLDPGGVDQVNIPKSDWPPAETQYRKFHLDAVTRTLSRHPVAKASSVSYDAKTGQAAFSIRFEEDTCVIGYPTLRLWVEVAGANDMDLFVVVQKIDDNGKVLQARNRYNGTGGRLRASLRALDPKRSTHYLPIQTFRETEFLGPGQIVPLDIAIAPTGMVWHKGEQLRLTVAGDVLKGITEPVNAGTHIIHTGQKYESYLQLPIVSLK